MKTVSLAEALAGILNAREKHAQIVTNPRAFFVHVRIPDHVSSRLQEIQQRVLPDAATHQDIDHATLVFTKKPIENHPPEKVHAALESLRQLGQQTAPIDARIQGWAYFDGASKDGKPHTALVALLDAPGLEHLHVDASRALADHGIEASKSHVFTPHITLGYLPQHGRVEGTLPPIDGTFEIEKIHVASRDTHEVPLTGEASSIGQKAAAWALSPPARAALIGSSIGAGAGLLGSGLDYANDSDSERQAQPLWKRMLINGGIGAVGGGIVGATHRLSRPTSPTSDLVDSMTQQRWASVGEEAAAVHFPEWDGH